MQITLILLVFMNSRSILKARGNNTKHLQY